MTKKISKKTIVWCIIIALFFLMIWIIWGNTALELNIYCISSEEIPDSFNGYRIAQVSDLHNAEFGDNNETLLNMLKEASPDIIVITGDLIDSRNTNIEIGIAFAQQSVKIAPTYYITGNHEARISAYDELEKGLKDAGVVILRDKAIQLEEDGSYISLIGIDDPSFETDYLFGDSATVIENTLHDMTLEDNSYTILLSHRPELFEVYVENGIDLVFSGHAHGGQFRLPFVGGIVAPNQGFFPKYDTGLYIEDNTKMIVSKGIGNSIIPFRFNNRPEVILVELNKEL